MNWGMGSEHVLTFWVLLYCRLSSCYMNRFLCRSCMGFLLGFTLDCYHYGLGNGVWAWFIMDWEMGFGHGLVFLVLLSWIGAVIF